MTSPTVKFPFERNIWYSFHDFEEFERQLLSARRADKQLSAKLRLGVDKWMKLRNEELWPAFHYSRHLGLAPTSKFRMMHEGAATDIEIEAAGGVRRLQITTAGPVWPQGHVNWGVDHRLHMEQLNEAGESSGWGPYQRDGGYITNRDEAISTDERNPAYLAGLVGALKRKKHHQQEGAELIVYADGYDKAMDLETFTHLADEALLSVPDMSFTCIHMLAAANGYCHSSCR